MAGALSHWWKKDDHLVTGDRRQFSDTIWFKIRSENVGDHLRARTRENALALLLLAEAGELNFSNLETFELQMVAESKES